MSSLWKGVKVSSCDAQFWVPTSHRSTSEDKYVINLTKHNFSYDFPIHSNGTWIFCFLISTITPELMLQCVTTMTAPPEWQLLSVVRNDRICKPRLFKENTQFLSDSFTVNHCCILPHTLDIPILKLLWLACWKGLQWCRAEYSISAVTNRIFVDGN